MGKKKKEEKIETNMDDNNDDNNINNDDDDDNDGWSKNLNLKSIDFTSVPVHIEYDPNSSSIISSESVQESARNVISSHERKKILNDSKSSSSLLSSSSYNKHNLEKNYDDNYKDNIIYNHFCNDPIYIFISLFLLIIIFLSAYYYFWVRCMYIIFIILTLFFPRITDDFMLKTFMIQSTAYRIIRDFGIDTKYE